MFLADGYKHAALSCTDHCLMWTCTDVSAVLNLLGTIDLQGLGYLMCIIAQSYKPSHDAHGMCFSDLLLTLVQVVN